MAYDEDDDAAPPHPYAHLEPPPPDVLPRGEAYDWYQRAVELIDAGSPHPAIELLKRVVSDEPESRSVREALARAQFDAGMYAEARDTFEWIIDVNPADDYAQFGLGLSAARTGDLTKAVEHLALAAAMRPDISHYAQALRGARATLAAQK
ncbi:MAG TPA: tetratricopeptide repeat protein [Mycobacteriales bacterium]|nr:tetratricopeptide repeat protein [Mycobacteriales bacterium]